MDDQNSDAPLKIVINGQEFDETEANDLIETGRKTREYEQKWNTSLDKVWPEYGKSRETLKSLEQELSDAKAQLSSFSSKKEEGTETNQDVAQAQEAARKLGITLKEDLDKAGYIKKDELDSYFTKKEEERQAVKRVLDQADTLEKEITGADGRPKFNKRAVLAYASAYGYADVQAAYEDMYKEDLAPWKDAQIAAKKVNSLKTLSAGGNKSPKTPKVNDSNLKEQLSEALWGNQE